jgi:hypothetical protein
MGCGLRRYSWEGLRLDILKWTGSIGDNCLHQLIFDLDGHEYHNINCDLIFCLLDSLTVSSHGDNNHELTQADAGGNFLMIASVLTSI